jgi:threo-3-hydroxy-L-aspartate ammonia-lyase
VLHVDQEQRRVCGIDQLGELVEDVFSVDVDQRRSLFVPLGGGGLLAGSALSARAMSPGCRVYGVEPEAGNHGQRSLREGTIVHIDTPKTIADGAQTRHLGAWTFDVIRREVTGIHTATDAELVEAMRTFFTFMKIVVEPTGCLGLAAARSMAARLRGQRVGVIISGGNIDLGRFASLLAA